MVHPIQTSIFGIPFALVSLAQAWDSPLPFLAQPAGTDLAAFANPAAASRVSEDGSGLAFGRPDSLEGPWKRLWAAHHQENNQSLGFRLWEGGAKTEGELGWSGAKDAGGMFSTGMRLTWRYREDAPDQWGSHAGFQVRPHPSVLAGYWGENLWTWRASQRLHRFSMGLRPMAGAGGRIGEFSVGYGLDFPEDESRREAVYVQVPLPFSTTAHGRWDWNSRQGAVGIAFQATPQMVAAWGLTGFRGAPSKWDLPNHREAALRFRKPRSAPYLMGQGKVVELDLNRSLAEGEASETWFGGNTDLSFLQLARRFDQIEADDRIRAVVLRLGNARAGWGMGEEVRNRILALRAKGRRVVAYMEQATPLNYYLASAADVVAMQPGGHFAVNGFSSEVTFFRGFFDKLGVEPQFLRHGRYKSFEEPYTRKEMSPEARTNLEGYLGSQWDYFLDAVASGRKLPKDSVARVLSAGDPNLDRALAAGLIDTLVDQDQLVELAGGPRAALLRLTGEGVRETGWEIPPRIALVVVQGDMVMGSSSKGWLGSPQLAGAKTVAAELKRARLDPDIEAVVLRVDSPGGSAQAADIMSREVELLRKAGKPVVASIGHVAASGGYYLICGADRIYGAHNSAIGSIGILWGKFVIKGLQDKVGISTSTVRTAPHADANSMSRPWDSAEVAALQRHMDAFYDRFTGKVAAGRKLTREQVDSLAQGRIFTGTQSRANGLVDSIGGLFEAVREAARLARIEDGRRVDLVPIQSRGGRTWVGPMGAATSREEALEALVDRGWDSLVERYRELAEGQLWAFSPELAGWGGPGL
jgi:signal peptide peptidase SppA